MAIKAKAAPAMHPNNTLALEKSDDETGAQAMARKLLEPHLRHAVIASNLSGKMLGTQIEPPGLMDFVGQMQAATAKAEAGDMSMGSRLLAAQAVTLDSMFTELARRSALNMGEYPDAADRYGRLALKAQGNCRATVEALAKLHQPREQTVRHVHVNEGGQAVVADQFHHHTGGHQNAESTEQPYAAGADAAGSGPAMLGHDAQGNGLPVPGDQWCEAMSYARRQGQRRA